MHFSTYDCTAASLYVSIHNQLSHSMLYWQFQSLQNTQNSSIHVREMDIKLQDNCFVQHLIRCLWHYIRIGCNVFAIISTGTRTNLTSSTRRLTTTPAPINLTGPSVTANKPITSFTIETTSDFIGWSSFYKETHDFSKIWTWMWLTSNCM